MSLDRRGFLAGAVALGAPLSGSPATAATVDDNGRFPEGFVWGAATSAYQIEGGTALDGRGPSIWDTFCRRPGAVRDGSSGDVACDSWRRWPEDVALLKSMGLRSYRFSVAWPRIQPTGSGPALPAGLDGYSRQVDALLAAGIRPMVTLYHWDLPQPLEDAGGWPNRDTADRFADYADLVARRLGDRVRCWAVLNEPKAFTQAGYAAGLHAPGRKDPEAAFRATHVANLAYAGAWRALKANDARAEVGSAFDMAAIVPASGSPEDQAAARRLDAWSNRWYLEPLLTGAYPDLIEPTLQARLLGWRDGDAARLKTGVDWLGVNYYTPWLAQYAPDRTAPLEFGLKAQWSVAPNGPRDKTDIGWEIWPEGLTRLLLRAAELAPGVPIEITENGAAYSTGPGPDGRVRDSARIAYLRDHLRAVSRAIAAGAPVRGFHAWSLMDNFEWQEGYTQRFGLVHVDYARGARRTPKDSALWYAKVAASNRV